MQIYLEGSATTRKGMVHVGYGTFFPPLPLLRPLLCAFICEPVTLQLTQTNVGCKADRFRFHDIYCSSIGQRSVLHCPTICDYLIRYCADGILGRWVSADILGYKASFPKFYYDGGQRYDERVISIRNPRALLWVTQGMYLNQGQVLELFVAISGTASVIFGDTKVMIPTCHGSDAS